MKLCKPRCLSSDGVAWHGATVLIAHHLSHALAWCSWLGIRVSHQYFRQRVPQPPLHSQYLFNSRYYTCKEHEIIQQLFLIIKLCKSCVITDRKAIIQIRSKKSLQKISNNNRVSNERRRRISCNKYECMLCDIRICNNNSCFEKHLRAIR